MTLLRMLMSESRVPLCWLASPSAARAGRLPSSLPAPHGFVVGSMAGHQPSRDWWLERCGDGGCRPLCRRPLGCVTAVAPAALLCASARTSPASGVSDRPAASERYRLVPGTRGGMMLMGVWNISVRQMKLQYLC